MSHTLSNDGTISRICSCEICVARRSALPPVSRPEPWRCADCGQGYPCECRLEEQDAESERALPPVSRNQQPERCPLCGRDALLAEYTGRGWRCGDCARKECCHVWAYRGTTEYQTCMKCGERAALRDGSPPRNGNYTMAEYVEAGRPSEFVWNGKIRMWMRQTGPCLNCGWQPGDTLRDGPPPDQRAISLLYFKAEKRFAEAVKGDHDGTCSGVGCSKCFLVGVQPLLDALRGRDGPPGEPPQEGDPLVEVLELRKMVKRLEAEVIRLGGTWPSIGAIERGTATP